MAHDQKAWLWSANPILPLICLVTMGTCASFSSLVSLGLRIPVSQGCHEDNNRSCG